MLTWQLPQRWSRNPLLALSGAAMTQAPHPAMCCHHLLHTMQAGWLQALLAADSNSDAGQHPVAH